MATVRRYIPLEDDFYEELQRRTDLAESRRHIRFKAAVLIQRMARGWLVRQHMARLHHAATIIQCAFRCHLARKLYRAALKAAVRKKHAQFYYEASTKIEVGKCCSFVFTFFQSISTFFASESALFTFLLW